MKNYNETEIQVLKYIDFHPDATIEQMCQDLYLGRTSITRYLKKFKEENLIYDNGEKKPYYKRILTNQGRLLLTKR